MQSENDALKQDLFNANTRLEDLDTEKSQHILQLRSEKEQIQSDLNAEVAEKSEHISQLQSEKEQIQSDLEKSKSDVALSRTSNEQLILSAKELEAQLMEMETSSKKEKGVFETDVRRLQSENDSLKQDLVNTNTRLEDLNAEVAEKNQLISQLQFEKKQIQSDLDTDMTEKGELISHLQSEKQQIQSSLDAEVAAKSQLISQLQSEKERIKSEMDKLNSDASLSKTSNEQLMLRLEDLEAQLTEAQSTNQKERGDFETELSRLQSENNSLKQDLFNINTRLEDLGTEKNQLILQLRSEKEQIQSDLDTEVAEKSELISQLQSEKEQIQRDLEKSKSDVALSKTSNEQLILSTKELEAQLTVAKSSYETERRALQGDIKAHSDTVAELKQEILSMTSTTEEEIRRQEEIVSELHTSLVNSNEKVASLEGEVQILEKEKQEALAVIERVRASQQEALTRFGAREEEFQKETERLKLCVETAEAAVKVANSREDANHSEHESEVAELKQLLALANESVNEARDAAIAADEELDAKEKSMEEIVKLLSEREEELQSMSKQMHQLKAQVEAHEGQEQSTALATDLLLLRSQKRDLESQLENERSARLSWESEHRRQMGEEQRLLIQEAENEMSTLRREAQQLRAALTAAESESYEAKQEIDEMLDQTKRLENRALEAERLQADLQRKLDVARAENAALEQRIVDMSTEMESKLRQSTVEATKAKTKAKAQTEEFEDMLKRLKSELSTAKRTIENKENIYGQDNRLKNELKELRAELDRKDHRINKLEKTKFTKEHAAAVRRLKVGTEHTCSCFTCFAGSLIIRTQEERTRYLDESEEYKTKLSKAEEEIQHLQLALRSSDSGALTNPDEVTELKFQKEALETKLRKYLSYCKTLESDKTQIVDALKMHKRNVIDGDFAGAIVSLCDDYASLEEENDALSASEARATSYLVEMDRLREDFASSKIDVKKNEVEIRKLTKRKSELESLLKDSEEKLQSVRLEKQQLKVLAGSQKKEVASPQDVEQSKKIKYLEKENLRLMQDLKASKKALQATRAQLDAGKLRPTEDTDDFGRLLVSGGKRKVLGTRDENRDSNSNHSPSDVAKGSESVKKRRLARATRMKQRREGNAVGLGEVGPVDDENTGECKQS